MNNDLRNKLGSYEPTYNPKHWEQLSERLALANKKRRFGYAIAATLLLFIFIGSGLEIYHKNTIQNNSLLNSSKINSNENYVSPIYLSEDTIIADSNETKSITNNSSQINEKIHKEKITNKEVTNKEVTNKAITKDVENTKKSTKSVAKNNLKTTEKQVSNSNKKHFNSAKKISNKRQNNLENTKKLPDNLPQNSIKELSKTDTFSFITSIKDLRFTNYVDTLKPKFPYYQITKNNIINDSTQKTKYLFRIGALLLPMATIWKLDNEKDVLQGFMLNAGIMAEYRIKKFVIGSGILVSNYGISSAKQKSLDLNIDSTYKVSTYLSSQQQTQELLIPILLRYDIKINQKSYWFITANILNSFIISDNQFQRTTTEYNNNLTSGIPSINNNKVAYFDNNQKTNNVFQAFSALQLQIGYEKMLAKHFSCQIEPFVRLSLQSQANNQLQSYSTGMILRINYIN